MLEFLSGIFLRITLGFYEPLGAFIFSIPLKKRPKHRLFGVLSLLFYYVLTFSLDYFEVIWFLQVILKFFALALISFSITKSSYIDSIYCAVWGYTTHMLLFNTICALQFVDFFQYLGLEGFFLRSTPIYILGYLLSFLIARRLFPEGEQHIETKYSVIAVLTILPFNVFNNVIYQKDGYFSTNLSSVYCCIFSCACCMFVLYLQRTAVMNAQLHQEYHLMQQLLNQRQLQYELSKENIDIINQKCHDLKHQINALKELPSSEIREEYIKEVSNSIMIYESVFHTGNEVLDTLLTEKSLFCRKYDITIKCIADGKALSFMDPIDLYSLLGNAIDNAFESVCQLSDESLRMINLYVRNELNFVTICVENYIAESPVLVDGIPLTTKKDKHNHGFGIKSMKYTAEKYDGQMTVNLENNMFVLRFLFPIQ